VFFAFFGVWGGFLGSVGFWGVGGGEGADFVFSLSPLLSLTNVSPFFRPPFLSSNSLLLCCTMRNKIDRGPRSTCHFPPQTPFFPTASFFPLPPSFYLASIGISSSTLLLFPSGSCLFFLPNDGYTEMTFHKLLLSFPYFSTLPSPPTSSST